MLQGRLERVLQALGLAAAGVLEQIGECGTVGIVQRQHGRWRLGPQQRA